MATKYSIVLLFEKPIKPSILVSMLIGEEFDKYIINLLPQVDQNRRFIEFVDVSSKEYVGFDMMYWNLKEDSTDLIELITYDDKYQEYLMRNEEHSLKVFLLLLKKKLKASTVAFYIDNDEVPVITKIYLLFKEGKMSTTMPYLIV